MNIKTMETIEGRICDLPRSEIVAMMAEAVRRFSHLMAEDVRFDFVRDAMELSYEELFATGDWYSVQEDSRIDGADYAVGIHYLRDEGVFRLAFEREGIADVGDTSALEEVPVADMAKMMNETYRWRGMD